jgi:hypothetical protein
MRNKNACKYCKGTGIADEKAEVRERARDRAKRNDSWKQLEAYGAKLLRGKRVLRGFDWSFSDVDIRVADIPFLKIDAKKFKHHAIHSLMREIVRKYAPKPYHIPLLIQKEHGPSPVYATIPLEFLAVLLDVLRAYAKSQGVAHLTAKRYNRIRELVDECLSEVFPVSGLPKDVRDKNR